MCAFARVIEKRNMLRRNRATILRNTQIERDGSSYIALFAAPPFNRDNTTQGNTH